MGVLTLLKSAFQPASVTAVERCASALGWGIARRENGNRLLFEFPVDNATPRRKVWAVCVQHLVVFFCMSEYAPKKVPRGMQEAIERRQPQFVHWEIDDGMFDDFTFSVKCTISADALTPTLMRGICQEAVGEIEEFEFALRESGLI